MKQARKKYGDQTEEERAIALKLLGSKPMQSEPVAQPKEPDPKDSKPDPSNPPEEGESLSKHIKNRKKLQEQREREQRLEVERLKRAAKSSQPDTVDLGDLHRLVATPGSNDALEFCIPCVAPYSVVQDWPYKFKIQPGIEKRGKAVKKMLNALIATCKEQHKPYIRSVKDTDCIQVLLTGVKISGLPSKRKNYKGRGRR